MKVNMLEALDTLRAWCVDSTTQLDSVHAAMRDMGASQLSEFLSTVRRSDVLRVYPKEMQSLAVIVDLVQRATSRRQELDLYYATDWLVRDDLLEELLCDKSVSNSDLKRVSKQLSAELLDSRRVRDRLLKLGLSHMPVKRIPDDLCEEFLMLRFGTEVHHVHPRQYHCVRKCSAALKRTRRVWSSTEWQAFAEVDDDVLNQAAATGHVWLPFCSEQDVSRLSDEAILSSVMRSRDV